MDNKHIFKGRIEVICGSMFSGKTEELIRRIKKVELADEKYIIFKPKIDSRNPENKIISHAKNEISASIVSSPKEILDLSVNYPVIGIDEAQFFDQSIVDVLRIDWPKISQTCHINHLMMATLGSSYRTAIKDSNLRLLLDKEGLQLHWLSLEAYC